MADDDASETLRLFVAIPLPGPVRKEIAGVQRELQRQVPPQAVRWTPPEQFHLTLKFLGAVPAGCISALREALRTACAQSAPLPLRAEGAGFFPNARSPRVVWVGVNDNASRLADLQRGIETAVESFTREARTERFAGHVTLGRVKFLKPQEIGRLTACAETSKHRRLGDWTAGAVELIQSQLSSTGAQHTVLASFLLEV